METGQSHREWQEEHCDYHIATKCEDCGEDLCGHGFVCDGCGETFCSDCMLGDYCMNCHTAHKQEVKTNVLCFPAELITALGRYAMTSHTEIDGVHNFEFEDSGASIKRFEIIISEDDCE